MLLLKILNFSFFLFQMIESKVKCANGGQAINALIKILTFLKFENVKSVKT